MLTPSSFPAREMLLLHHMLKLHVGREEIGHYFHPKALVEPGGEACHADSEMAAASPGCLFNRSIPSGNKAGLHSASPGKGGKGEQNQQGQPKIPDTPLLLPLHHSWGCPSPPGGIPSTPGDLQRSLAASRAVGTLSSACHAAGTGTFGSCLPGRCLECSGNMSQSSLLSLTSPSCSFIQHIKYLPCGDPRFPGGFFFLSAGSDSFEKATTVPSWET